MKKRFVPCIYLYNEHAVKGLNDKTIIETDPLRLIDKFNGLNVDALIIFDMSYDDESHEKSLDLIKAICEKSACEVYTGGNIKRFEDVKKILYTGSVKAIIDMSDEINVSVLPEAFARFGADKLIARFDSTEDYKKYSEDISKSTSDLILMNIHDYKSLKDAYSGQILIHTNEVLFNKLIELLSDDQISGITGNCINDNINEIENIKQICRDNNIEVDSISAAIKFDQLKLNSDSLIPVIVQDYKTSEVLMLAYMNEQAYNDTLRTGLMHYYSRSRGEQWLKGETSGHYQYVKSMHADCDLDTLVVKVKQIGAACHTGKRSCFFNEVFDKNEASENPLMVFEEVYNVIKDRKENPKEGSYTNYLFDKGIDKILKKVGEEATEIVIAAKNPNPNEIIYEISDFLYHAMVLMALKEVTWEDITKELANR